MSPDPAVEQAAAVLADASHSSCVIVDDLDALDATRRRALRNHLENADQIEAAYSFLVSRVEP